MASDLAIEFAADKTKENKGIFKTETLINDIKVTLVKIENQDVAIELGKEKGEYLSFESNRNANIFDTEGLSSIIADNLSKMLSDVRGTALVVGIGNIEVTPDAIGPKTARKIFATRHLDTCFLNRFGLENLKPVAAIAPGVLGQTGIEILEIVKSISSSIKPDVIIFIDALAADEVSRLGSCIQISNTGISPGSGVGNKRAELSIKTLGVNCITIGVPTVTDASYLLNDNRIEADTARYIITPREIDRILETASSVLADALNNALQPLLDRELLSLIV